MFYVTVFDCLADIGQEHDNCMTWEDDWKTLYLTCRVNDFKKSVTFKHKNSGNRVVCKINEEEKCNPEGKRFTINRHNHTITIVLEENKRYQNLDGEWLCIQGASILKTQVQTMKGIITDTWVRLKGSKVMVRNNPAITLECSSCRKPKDLHAEFLENGKTTASLTQDNQGHCLYKQTECKPEKCSCLPTSNVFKITLDIQQSMNYSCSMQFNDQHRNGTFSITASANYTGEDFTVWENKTEIIKNNTDARIDLPQPTTVKSIWTTRRIFRVNTVVGTHLSRSTTSKSDYVVSSTDVAKADPEEAVSRSYLSSQQTAVVTAVVFIVLLIFGIIGATIFILWKKGKISCTKEYELIEMDDFDKHSLEVTCSPCEKKKQKKNADKLCFVCRKYFCNDCFDSHDIIEMVKSHSHVDVTHVPKNFNISMLNCAGGNDHKNSVVNWFCNKHELICCDQCKSEHKNCKGKDLDKFFLDKTLKVFKKYFTELNWCQQWLTANKEIIKNDLEQFRMQIRFTQKQIELQPESVSYKFDTIYGEFDRQLLKKKEVLRKLDCMLKERQKEFYTEICDVENAIKHQKENLDFLIEYGRTTDVIIALKQFTMKCLKSKQKLENLQKCVFVHNVQSKDANTRLIITRDNVFSTFFTTLIRHLHIFRDRCNKCIGDQTIGNGRAADIEMEETRVKNNDKSVGKKNSDVGKNDTHAGKKDSDADKKDSDADTKDSDVGKKDSDAGKKNSDVDEKDSDADKKDSDAGEKDANVGKKDSDLCGNKKSGVDKKDIDVDK